MLNIEKMLKLTEEMNVEVRDSTDGKHYILDDLGEEVEFNVNMVTKVDKNTHSYQYKLKYSNKHTFDMSNDVYQLSGCETAYTPKPVNLENSIIIAV